MFLEVPPSSEHLSVESAPLGYLPPYGDGEVSLSLKMPSVFQSTPIPTIGGFLKSWDHRTSWVSEFTDRGERQGTEVLYLWRESPLKICAFCASFGLQLVLRELSPLIRGTNSPIPPSTSWLMGLGIGASGLGKTCATSYFPPFRILIRSSLAFLAIKCSKIWV